LLQKLIYAILSLENLTGDIYMSSSGSYLDIPNTAKAFLQQITRQPLLQILQIPANEKTDTIASVIATFEATIQEARKTLEIYENAEAKNQELARTLNKGYTLAAFYAVIAGLGGGAVVFFIWRSKYMAFLIGLIGTIGSCFLFRPYAYPQYHKTPNLDLQVSKITAVMNLSLKVIEKELTSLQDDSMKPTSHRPWISQCFNHTIAAKIYFETVISRFHKN
jgi:hypothetical protein